MEQKLNEVKDRIRQEFEYISNDPEENADNFDPKWASFRELNTDKERYKAIRKRWGNADIPDPQINLTFRQIKKDCESEVKESASASEGKGAVPDRIDIQTCPPTDITNREQTRKRRSRSCTRSIRWDSETKENEPCGPNACNGSEPTSVPVWPPMERKGRNRQVSRRRSRSCTRPYERLISDLEKNYTAEYSQLMHRHSAELNAMFQVHFQRLGACGNSYGNGISLKIQHDKEVLNLLSNHYEEVHCLLGEKKENIEACVRYMEEVKAFFTFYQKMNDDEVTLQMTDEQYEHTVETERMYALYSNFYK